MLTIAFDKTVLRNTAKTSSKNAQHRPLPFVGTCKRETKCYPAQKRGPLKAVQAQVSLEAIIQQNCGDVKSLPVHVIG